ncbi:MAG: MoaD/ThiS family protein, partial [bacterium]
DYATLAAPVQDGDEVAFFPPITGGSTPRGFRSQEMY